MNMSIIWQFQCIFLSTKNILQSLSSLKGMYLCMVILCQIRGLGSFLEDGCGQQLALSITPSDIRNFLGLASYYRRTVEWLSSIVSHLKDFT